MHQRHQRQQRRRPAENLAKQRSEFAQHWRIEDGELVNGGAGPYAATEEEFGNIELLLEYKTVAGAVGGAAVAVVLAVLFVRFALQPYARLSMSLAAAASFGLLAPQRAADQP
jgi:hypothetical protein